MKPFKEALRGFFKKPSKPFRKSPGSLLKSPLWLFLRSLQSLF